MQAETRRATIADLDEASSVLAAAFVDYPWIQWTVQEDDRLHRVTQLQRTSLQLLGLAYGQVWVTTLGGTVASVAVLMDSSVVVPASVERRNREIAARLEGTRNLPSIEAENAICHLRPTSRHVVLATIGTSPEIQGRGLGSRTLAAALNSPEVVGDTYLETSTPRNVAFYERFGFAVRSCVKVAPDGPEVWSMTRTV